MEVNGLENITTEQLSQEVMRGGRFVVFEYCISLLIITFKRPSGIYYLRPEESAFSKSIGFTLISLVFGWWGFPWGPIYTIGSFITNFRGGKDVTIDVMNALDPKTNHRNMFYQP